MKVAGRENDKYGDKLEKMWTDKRHIFMAKGGGVTVEGWDERNIVIWIWKVRKKES